VWQQVSPVFGVVGTGSLRPSGGPAVTSECGGHIARWSVVFDACCCVKMRVALRSHDSVGFRNEGFVSVVAEYGGGNGGVGVCSECVGVCIRCKVVRGGFWGACSPM
jgi:hypothetical protein